MEVEFGEWLPDLPDYKNPGSTVITNVLPATNAYEPFPGSVVYSSALTARAQGAFGCKETGGSTVNFAGDATKLYKRTAATFSDVSKVGGYTTGTDERWYFAKYGERVMATNYTDDIQSFVLGSSSVFANVSADVTRPKARYITVLRDFVLVGNTYDSGDGIVPHRVRWSGIGDPTSWTVSPVTQSDYNDLNATRGWVQQVVGGEYGVVFQERAISRMIYVGSPDIFQFDEVEADRGTPAPGSVIKFGSNVGYLDRSGFYIFNGNQSVPIGAGKIDKTFWAEVDENYLSRITAAHYPTQQIILWAYPATGNVGGRSNRILAYCYSQAATKRWALVDSVDIEMLFNTFADGYTLEDLDAFSSSIDALSFSLDSRVWTGNSPMLAGFDSSHRQINYSGDAMDATLETTEAQLYPSNRARVSLIRPIVDGSGTVTMKAGSRNLQSESVTWGASTSVNTTGNCPVRSNGRYHRARVSITGGFNQAIGVDIIKAEKAGMR